MRRQVLLVVIAMLAARVGVEAQAAQEPNSDEAAIRATVQSYVAAYNRGDAKAVAEHWNEAGEWINPSGERVQGHAAIERQMGELFARNAGEKIEVSDLKIRLVSSGVAIEEGTARVTGPGDAPSESTYLAIHVKQNGQWKLDSVRETEARGATEAKDNLKQLEWMVGQWIDESPDVVVEHQCKWSDDGHFLLGEFLVQYGRQPTLKGTVRIGWDPLRRQIRSWVFDSAGGFSEGVWTKVGERWVVKMTGVRVDGATASATNVYTPIRRDQYRFASVDRLVGGQQEPDVVVTMIRKPPEAK